MYTENAKKSSEKLPECVNLVKCQSFYIYIYIYIYIYKSHYIKINFYFIY